MDPDITIDAWSTAALLEAVIEALLEDPERIETAFRALAPTNAS